MKAKHEGESKATKPEMRGFVFGPTRCTMQNNKIDTAQTLRWLS